jgi:hypothetical protein
MGKKPTMQRTSNASIYKKNYKLFKKLKFFKKICKRMQMLIFFFHFSFNYRDILPLAQGNGKG